MKTYLQTLTLAVCLTPVLFADDQARDTLIVETLVRLNRYDLSAVKPETREAVLRHIDTQQGTARFVELVELFNIRDRNEALMQLAIEQATAPVGVQAARLLIKYEEMDRIQAAMTDAEPAVAVQAMAVFAATQDRQIADWLVEAVTDRQRPASVRSAAVRGLGMGLPGEKRLLEIVAAGKLPPDMNFTAANVLLISRDESIRTAAARYLKLPSAGSKPLPPITELVKRKGDVESGKAAYTQATCIACHTIGPMGIDYGPALTEIGDKLSKEALYAAILDPSAGISFGYEGWVVVRKDGAQLQGYIMGETGETLTLKIMGGVAIPIPKREIAERKPLSESLMTPNLQQLISEQQLIDLVEYLATLRKPKP